MGAINASDDRFVWDAWYPLGASEELRRRRVTRTWLLGREIEISIDPTRVSVSCSGKQLPAAVNRPGFPGDRFV